MPRIRFTKNELKAQRDALKRFQRYLPTLQLKKQQLQMEVRQREQELRDMEAERKRLRDEARTWIGLFAMDDFDFAAHLQVAAIRRSEGNIAGVAIPVLDAVEFRRETPDLFATPTWVDDGLNLIEAEIRLRLEIETLAEQQRRLAEELRTTSQRVNLFEKVKIPEARNAIRMIRIFLGDQQTAEVARSKIAKKKTEEALAA